MMVELDLQFATFTEVLRWRAEHQPNRVAYTYLERGEIDGPQESWTYGQLDEKARTIAARLQAMDVEGETILLVLPSGLEFIASFFGCLYAGAIAVPTYPPMGNRVDERLQKVAIDAQPVAALTTLRTYASMKSWMANAPELQELNWIGVDRLTDDWAEDYEEFDANPDDLAFLQYTSGSTGDPKGVMVTQGNLIYNSRMATACTRNSAEDVWVGWLPLFHDMGLIGNMLQPIYRGCHVVLMSPTRFLQRPLRWLQAMSHYGGTFAGAPNFAYEMCVRKTTPEQRAALNLSKWRLAYNGAEPVRVQTLRDFAEAFAVSGFRESAFFPCYGLAEATLFVAGGSFELAPTVLHVASDALEQNRIELVAEGSPNGMPIISCGEGWLDEQIAIVDPTTEQAVGEDMVGEIWVSGSTVTQGYWQRPDISEATFRAPLGDRRYLRTGDLGFIHNGELYITGRLKDLIIIRGRNQYPQDIEATVQGVHRALRADCGAVFQDDGEALTIVQEVDPVYVSQLPQLDLENKIRLAVSQKHQLRVRRVVLVMPGQVPKTSSGKIRRRHTRQQLRAGQLRIIGA